MKYLFIIVTSLMLTMCSGQKSEKEESYEAYLFTYFINNEPEGEQLRYAVSADGFNWSPLNNGERVVDLDNVARTKCIRDPHILRTEDGKSFYIVATDMKSSDGWSSNDGIVMMRSEDLVNWTSRAVDFPTDFPEIYNRDTLTRVWAPQTIYDAEAGKYMVYYSIENGSYLTIYYSYADDDFTHLTVPEKLADFGGVVLDADIVYNDGQYHMFLSGITKATSTSLHGPWEGYSRTKHYQQTDKAAEGPGVFKVNNSDEWILMYDCFRDGYYQFCKSTDLENFTLVAQTETTGAFTPRHGTVIGITRTELERLLEAFPSDGLTVESILK